MRQHITDPESCIQCSACEMSCPAGAIQANAGRYCIDANVCTECKKCIEECPTGAADCYIETSILYSQEEQASWTSLPRDVKTHS